jgi:cellulose synthase/poly-beta-1,6-N-acetylglucosamine synthase-like glycosyltransferase
MTVCVPSHKRSESLKRLLVALDREAKQRPAVVDGLDVLVVLDGGCATSVRMIKKLALSVPVSVHEEPLQGRAATRNRLAQQAQGSVLLFLDDDMEPQARLIERHRQFHDSHSRAVLVGRWSVPEGWNAAEPNARGDADDFSNTVADGDGRIRRFDGFSCANTSIPRDLFLEAGGFDELFRGYGEEDSELGMRLLARGIAIHHDPRALAWHLQKRNVIEDCRLRSEAGKNYIRFASLHPSRASEIFPIAERSCVRQLLRAACRRSPTRYRATMWLFIPGAYWEWIRGRGDHGRFSRWARTAALLAGMVELDPDGVYTDLWFGRPTSVRDAIRRRLA